MKKLILLLALLSPSIARANTVTPQFTTGNMTSNTVTTQTIKEVTKKEVMGAAVKTWSGTNVTASGNITAADTTFTVKDDTKAWTLETTTRAAGLIEKWDITTDYTINSTTNSYSVFSQ
ncbi:MAG: hypothetical protein CMG35_10510 [Candidatus Marinimicrobia bacterium]|jgi:MinD superfamily P-loop ATPase|nr:hypothetical protein [Candidatus Neomarinimicrobiota bacterium]|tara:strand:- start:338 stop:694 length:357 start_codon:yes stop_codon:yes gene_type:complete